MIIRIVKMTFRDEECDNFLLLFDEVKDRIRSFEGCRGVDLLRDIKHSNIFFTYSKWDSEDHLEQYRNSELFKSTWKRTKSLFAEKAKAWSVEQL